MLVSTGIVLPLVAYLMIFGGHFVKKLPWLLELKSDVAKYSNCFTICTFTNVRSL